MEFDQNGKVIAASNIIASAPWTVLKSKKFKDRYYFFNEDTKASEWSLSPSLVRLAGTSNIVLPSLGLSPSSISTDVSRLSSEDKTILKPKHNISSQTSIFAKSPTKTDGLDNHLERSGGGRTLGYFPQRMFSNFGSKKSSEKKSPQLGPLVSSSPLIDPSQKEAVSLDEIVLTDYKRQDTKSISLESFQDESEKQRKYDVIDGLGVGGFATVVKVEEVNSGKLYAMKVVFKNNKDNKKEQLARVKLELEMMTSPSLNKSPFLQKCHDAFENSSNVFFVIDLVEGGDLFSHLTNRLQTTNRGFAEFEVRFILAELFLAIEHLHDHGFIHRDIKIENIMLDARGHVKLVDYGLAAKSKQKQGNGAATTSDRSGLSILSSPSKSTSSAASGGGGDGAPHSQPMTASGSLIYLAPEVLHSAIGGRYTDWWAYGVLGYELMTGHIPWSSMENESLIKQEILCKEIAIPEILSLTSRHFLACLLERNYQKRLGSANDADIRAHLFFRGIDWSKMANQEYIPAFKPSGVNTDNRKSTMENRSNALSLYRKMVRASPSNSSLLYKYSSLKFGLKKADLFLV